MWTSEKIKALRLFKNLTQADLAEMIGTSQQHISDWETKHNPGKAYQKLLTVMFGGPETFKAQAGEG